VNAVSLSQPQRKDIQRLPTLVAKPEGNAKGKHAAVDKVVKLLEDLQAKVLKEGEREAATYNLFACFCKDITAEKTSAIQSGTDEKTSLSSKIENLASERDNLDSRIAGLVAEVGDTEAAIKTMGEQRARERAEYKRNAADLSSAVTGLQGAMNILRASKDVSLIQVKAMSATIRSAILLSDALGIAKDSVQHAAALFIQQEPPMENYKFHSEGIIETLEKLLTDFSKEQEQVESEEVKASQQSAALLQEKEQVVRLKNKEIGDLKKTKSKKIERIASNSKRLSTVSATLLDDQEYMSEVSQLCTDKAKAWDQRTRIRSDELSALTAAVEIIKSTVTEKTSASTLRLVERATTMQRVEAVAESETSMEAVEAEAEAVDADQSEPPAFLQKWRHRNTAKAHATIIPDDGRVEVMTLLRNKGEELHSTLLTSMATQIAADPFAKIKQLLQELITRLLTEAANEANQQAWCDKATQDVEQKRSFSASKIESLNSEMTELEARRDKLTEELAKLPSDISELKAKQEDAESIRKEEKAENTAAVEEAKAGLDAVKEAISILQKFYKSAARESVNLSLEQQKPLEDAPDAGFDVGEVYTGAQGSSTGIIGMLEVIQSDFQRTLSETRKAETKAMQEHIAFMTESGVSLAEKEVAQKQKIEQKNDAEEKLVSSEEDLKSQTTILSTTVKELLELKPTCVDTSMSYKERVARRKDEIDALNKALCILRAYAKYGPGGTDEC